MQKIQFYEGEDKHVCFKVHATDNAPFTIRSASWTLSWAGQEEASGECDIEEHILSAKIAPLRRTSYQLAITYQVAEDTLMEKIEVVVT